MAQNHHKLSFVIRHRGRYRVSGTKAVFVRVCVCVTVKEEHGCNLLLQRRDVQACHSEEVVVVRRGGGVGK